MLWWSIIPDIWKKSKKSLIISFSSSIFGEQTVQKGNTNVSSKNILTWKHLIADESYSNVSRAIKTEYQDRQKVMETYEQEYGCHIYSYYINDGKMIYMLTQHSMRNRKHHPFLLCTCKRGAFFKKLTNIKN